MFNVMNKDYCLAEIKITSAVSEGNRHKAIFCVYIYIYNVLDWVYFSAKTSSHHVRLTVSLLGLAAVYYLIK